MKNLWHNLPIPMPVWAPADGDGAAADAGDKAAEGDNKAAAGEGDKAGDKGAEGEADKGDAGDKAGEGDKDDKAGEGDKGGGDDDADAKGDWPEDWRERLAAGDDKKLERLKRYTDPMAVAKALIETQDQLRARGKAGVPDPNAPPPEDPEELKTWRAERGIPEAPEGYAVPDPVKDMVTDEDKPLVNGYFEKAHKEGISKPAAEWAVQQYFELRDAGIAAEAENDRNGKAETTAELKKLWGTEFKGNNALAREMVKKLGEDSSAPDWFAARLPDGRMLGNIPGFVQVMAQMGKREFGDEAFAGDANTSATKSRKEELQNIMKTDIDRWQRSPDLRKELFAILSAEERRNGGSAS